MLLLQCMYDFLSHAGGYIHVSIRDPIVVYSMSSIGDSIQYVDLSDLFPYPTSVFSPKFNLVGLNHELEGQLLLHDANVSTIVETYIHM